MWRSVRGTADYEPSLPIIPKHIDLEATFILSEERVIGKCTVSAYARRSDRVLDLHAVDFLTLSVSCEDAPCECKWSYDGELITIVWAEDLPEGTMVRVVVEYEVTAPPKALQFSQHDDQHPRRSRCVVSDHETERARYWIPCVDNPLVRTTAEFHISAFHRYEVLASGVLVSKSDPYEFRGFQYVTHHWKLDILTPSYLLCVAVGEFGKVELEPFGHTQLALFTSLDNRPDETLLATFGRTRETMQWLTNKLNVEFPLPKYYQVAAYGLHGAMENMTLVTWDDSWLGTAETAEEDWQITNRILLHEMAHTFFGNLVVVRHFAHAWLKEGWAHYMECVYLEDHCGRASFEAELCASAHNYIQECKEYQRPIVTRHFEHSFQLFDKHLYPGGAWRIHMLRRRMGDDKFWEMAHKWIERYRDCAVETAHFRLHCEELCKDPLAQFFDQWIFTAGYPRLECRYEYDLREEMLTLEVRQVQVKADGTGFFDMDLEVVVALADGSLITRTLSFDSTVRLSGLALLQVRLREPPSALYFDPEMCWLFSLQIDLPIPMLRNALSSAPDARNRLWAFEALLYHARGDSIEVVERVASAEPVWEIRLAMFDMLADRESRFVPLLVRLLQREKSPQALWRMLRRLDMRHRALRRYLLAVINEGRLLPYARMWALTALGCQRERADLVTLQSAFERDTTFQELSRQGVLMALGRHRTGPALDFLLARLSPAVLEVRLRPIAVRSVGRCASALPRGEQRRAIEQLLPLLHDRVYDVRRAAVDSLVDLKAVDAVEQIEFARSSFAAQDFPWLDSRKEKLIAESEKRRGVRGVESRVTQLQSQVQSLTATVARLEQMLADRSSGGVEDDSDDEDGSGSSLVSPSPAPGRKATRQSESSNGKGGWS